MVVKGFFIDLYLIILWLDGCFELVDVLQEGEEDFN